MSWTTPQNVLDRWIGPGVPDDTELIAQLIADAEIVILSKYPLIQERIDDDRLSIDAVIFVVVRMVTRQLRNPEGLTYWQQTTGPFGQARNYGNANLGIWLSEEEEEMLSPKVRGKAFEVDLAPDATIIGVVRFTESQLGTIETIGVVPEDGI
jgi:hypothetical protein